MAKALPDVSATVLDLFAEGDRVAVRVAIEGTHAGALWGVAPTGCRIRWTGNNLYRLERGRIAQEWASEDWLAVFRQLGLFEPPAVR